MPLINLTTRESVRKDIVVSPFSPHLYENDGEMYGLSTAEPFFWESLSVY